MQYEYIKNKVIKPTDYFLCEANEGYIGVPDYRSVDLVNLRNLIDSLDSSYFAYINVSPNLNMEKLSLDIYDTPDYADLIFFVNDYSPVHDIPYDYDVITSQARDKVQQYKTKTGKKLTEKDEQRLFEKYEAQLLEENNLKLEIKYIKPERLHDVISKAYELGILSNKLRLLNP